MTQTHIPKRRLGHTTVEVTPLGLGTWQFAGGHKGASGWYWPSLEESTAERIVRAAIDGGINWFDTAEVYGNGRSEQLISSSLKKAGKKPGEVVIVDKWWPLLRPADSIRKTISRRLACLNGFPIDLYLIHQPFSISSLKAQMNALADLVKANKVRSVGVSNFNAYQMKAAHHFLKERGVPLAVNQVKYNLLDRKIEKNGVLAAAKKLGVTIIAWSPLEQGLLTGRFHREPERLKRMSFFRRNMFKLTACRLRETAPLIEQLETFAKRYKATAAQVALNWLINVHGERIVTIAGASKPEQIDDCARAMRFKLTSQEIQSLTKFVI